MSLLKIIRSTQFGFAPDGILCQAKGNLHHNVIIFADELMSVNNVKMTIIIIHVIYF